MSRRSLGLLVAVLTLLLTPAAASAVSGTPAAVGVRVEGAADTLLPRTAVTTTTTQVVKDGTNACSGTSTAGALELATAGSWAGVWNGGFGSYSVDTVKGESHVFGSGRYWGLFLNGYAAPSGICGVQMQAGDELLVAAISETGTAGVLELAGVPATAKPGVPFTVTVTRKVTDFPPPTYDPVNSSAPVAGATVAGATTGADGTAAVTLSARGPATLRASDTGDVRSVPAAVCVTDGADGSCGTTVPPPAPVVVPPAPDALPALPSIGAIGEQQAFSAAKAPRELKGTVAADASGIKDVLLSLTRRTGKRCERYDGPTEAWVVLKPCGAQNGRFFSIGSSPTWSYLLPKALTKGRYVLDVRTVDGAGNVTRGASRGAAGSPRTRVVFHVR